MLSLFLLSFVALQEATTPVIISCGPNLGPPFDVIESRMETPFIEYTKSYKEYGGQQRQEFNNETNDWNYVDIIGQDIVAETWVNREDPSVIDVEWIMVVTNRLQSPWTYKHFDFILEVPYCPVPGTIVRGNVYWDWIDAAEWYPNYSPEEKRPQYLQEKNRYLFDSISGFVSKWQQTSSYERVSYANDEPNWRLKNGGANLFFNCRRVVSRIYDAPVIGAKKPFEPPRIGREIEWNGQMWKQRFPEQENALIDLGEMPMASDPYKGFMFHVSFALGGGHYIRYDENGNAIDPTKIEWLPNILILHAHARFKMLDPKYPDDGCPFSYGIRMDEEPDYSSDDVSVDEN